MRIVRRGWTAIARKIRIASIAISTPATSCASLTAPPDGDPPRFAVHEVPVTALDDAVPGRADFLKIDVEGAEDAVWRGMQRLISRSPGIGILLEFNPNRCRDAAAVLADMADRFPLREVNFAGRAVPCRADDVLAREEDTMLFLSASEPD